LRTEQEEEDQKSFLETGILFLLNGISCTRESREEKRIKKRRELREERIKRGNRSKDQQQSSCADV